MRETKRDSKKWGRRRKISAVIWAFLLVGLLLGNTAGSCLYCKNSGLKYFKNYSYKEFDHQPQNWGFIQAKNGLIYVANNGGVLEFDGVSWRVIDVPNLTVRSIAISENGTIYIGGINEIGYLAPDPKGSLKYKTLTDHLDDKDKNFSKVWRTHATKEGIFFRTSKFLFLWSPCELAKYRDFRCQKSEEEIAKSLNGYFKEEQLFVLNQALELYDYYTEKMKELDKKIESQYIKFAKKVDIKKKPLKKFLRSQKCRDKNAPDYDLRSYLYKITGVDLTRVPGLNILNIQAIISEIGIDMSRWPTMKHFTSWLALSPNNRITGGKKMSANTKKTDNRANKAFRLAALSAGKTNTAIGRFHRKMKLKDDASKAVSSTAHKLARIVYVMISKQVEYSEEILEHHEKMNKDKIIRNLKRKAANLGYNLVEKVA
jgi:hypothetical protein